MSYNSLATQSVDQALSVRVEACVQEQAHENAELAGTEVARRIREGSYPIPNTFMWPVCLNSEAEYTSTLAAENPNPGGDESVIADGQILAAVQANWPDDPAPPDV